MALIGNRSVLHKSPGRFLAGTVASGDRDNFDKHGMARNQQQSLGVLADTPSGYGMSGWIPPRRAGSMSSRSTDMLVSSSNLTLAGGQNISGSSDTTTSQTALIQAVAFLGGVTTVSLIIVPSNIIGGYNLTGDSFITNHLLLLYICSLPLYY